MNPDLNLTLYTKINSKQITDLNRKCKTTKILGKKIGKILQDLGLSRDLVSKHDP